MISYTNGDILQSPAQVITNPVNCVGAMGKGLAEQFKNRYPEMYKDYRARCAQGAVKPGQPYLFENDEVQVLNFPTKRDWREPSRLEDIDAGLAYLAQHYKEMGIYTLALPALGCGLGSLDWNDVEPLIERHLGSLPDLEVFVYLPKPTGQIAREKNGTQQNGTENRDDFAARDL